MLREELIESIFSNMQQMHRTGTAKFHALIGRADISPSQLELLKIVKHRQPISIKDIASDMRLTPGAVTQLLENLVTNGYLERAEDVIDRRITNISLAAGGKQKLQELWDQRMHLMKKIVDSLDDEELVIMLRVQDKMIAHIDEQASVTVKPHTTKETTT
jgi:DNA-binding MarR family transcriptional regulator